MQRFFVLVVLLFFQLAFVLTKNNSSELQPLHNDTYQLYCDVQLKGVVDFAVFERAVSGYNKIAKKQKHIITLIDFTKPSTKERLYVIDMKQRKLLYSSHVSHGRNSGGNFATSFSNVSGSYKSSLGFYVTESTYYGKNGYSLVLDGLEKGINDKAKERAIVMHGAAYSNPSTIAANGRLGRSLGCPALPESVSREIIDVIKGGSLLYIYANDEDYQRKSNY